MDGQSYLTDDGSQCSFRNFSMIRNSHAAVRRICLAQDDVAASLTIELIADFR